MVMSFVLYACGLMVLLSPVATDVGDQDFVGNVNRSCGTVLMQAFAVASPDADEQERDRTRDCAARARGLVGYGVLFLLLAVPVGMSAVLTEVRRVRLG